MKGVGECGVIPAAAAIISAIEHALDAFGVHITETPIDPARILELLNSVSSAPTAYCKNVLDEWTGRCSGFVTGVRAVVDRIR